MKNNTCMATDI